MSHGSKSIAALVTASAAALVGLTLFAPGDAAAQNKIVTIVLPEEPDALDNCSTNRSAIGRVLKQNINETLTELDVNDGSIKPRLATSWEQIDPTTWRFHLRPGVFFTDGAPLNAETVGKSIARTLDKNLSCQIRIKTFGDLTLETVAVDPLTLDIKTSKPEPILPTRMTVMSLDSPNTPHTDKMVTTIGTGPYVLASYKPGVEITLKRNDKYWGKAPSVDGAKYIWRKESAVIAAMIAVGEADFAPAIGKQDATDPVMDKSYISTETNYVRIESQVPPLDDRRVRLALNYAVDRTSMLGTIAPKEALLATHMVIPSVAGWNPEVGKKVYPYDPAKAKQLLAEAKAAGVPVDKHIDIFGRTNMFPGSTETMEALLTMWQAVGLNVTMRMLDVSQWTELNIHPNKGKNATADEAKMANRDPILLGHMHDNNLGDPVFSMYNKYACANQSSAHCNPDLDKLIATATATVQGPERVKAWQEVMKVVHEDMVADVFLFHLVYYARVGARLNFTPSSATNSEIPLEQMSLK